MNFTNEPMPAPSGRDHIASLDGPDLDQVMAESGEFEDEDWHRDQAMTHLGSHVMRCWQAAAMAKERHKQVMLSALRQRLGEYDPDILAEIRRMGGNVTYMMLTQVKCRAAESWIKEIMFTPGERPFTVDPTPVADIPTQVRDMIRNRVLQELTELEAAGMVPSPEAVQQRLNTVEASVQQHAQRKADAQAEGMEDYIDDIYVEGKFYDELESFVNDLVTYPTAFMNGPIRIMRRGLEWAEDEYGQVHPVVKGKIERAFRCVSPFDMFPGPDAKHLDDGYLIERRRFRRKALYDLKDVPGYDGQAIRDVIERYGDSGYELPLQTDDERDDLEGRHTEELSNDTEIEAIVYWGQIRGKMLLDWGLTEEEIPDPDDDYECNVIMVGEYIIRAALNPHPLFQRPYHSASFERVNGQIWGKGIPQLIQDVQQMANATARALANNMALSSGPMVEISVDRLADGETVTKLYPWRQIQTKEGQAQGAGAGQPAVRFHQPNSNVDSLVKVYEFFSQLADEHSGIPPYAQGVNTSGGAAGTASGLSMLMDHAARGIKQAVKNIDKVITRVTEALHLDVMLYDPGIDHLKLGDVKIRARASTALVNRERQALRQTELANAMNNPVDMQIIGPRGRAHQLRELFKAVNIDPENVVPTDDEIAMQQALAAMQQAAGPQQLPQGAEQTLDGNKPGGPQVA